MFRIEPATIGWLLEGDPAVRWQVQRDLLNAPPAVYEPERARVAESGWGKRLLDHQDAGGTWAGAIYAPKFTSTHFTLLALRRIGLPSGHRQALKGCDRLLESDLLPNVGPGFPERRGAHADLCIAGMVLSMLAYFGPDDARVHRLAEYLVEQQMEDGGWNCRAWRGDTHASFHTTCSVLEGLWDYQHFEPGAGVAVADAQARGREFLLRHRLYKSHRSGEVVNEAMTRSPFPPQWQYDYLKALDYFQAARAPRDERASDAIALLLSQGDGEGRWPQVRGHQENTSFRWRPPESPAGGTRCARCGCSSGGTGMLTPDEATPGGGGQPG